MVRHRTFSNSALLNVRSGHVRLLILRTVLSAMLVDALTAVTNVLQNCFLHLFIRFHCKMMFRLSLLLLVSSTVVNAVEERLSTELMSAFKKWVNFHDKKYDSHEEKLMRLHNWVENDGTHLSITSAVCL